MGEPPCSHGPCSVPRPGHCGFRGPFWTELLVSWAAASLTWAEQVWLTRTHLCFDFLAHGLLLGSSGPDIVEFCVCLQSRRAGASVLVDLCALLGSSGPGWGGCLHCTPAAGRAETSSPFCSRAPPPHLACVCVAWRVCGCMKAMAGAAMPGPRGHLGRWETVVGVCLLV